MSVQVTLTNPSSYSITVGFRCPRTPQLELDSGNTRKISVQAGEYEVTFDRPSRRDSRVKNYRWSYGDKPVIDAAAIFSADVDLASFDGNNASSEDFNFQLINNTSHLVVCFLGTPPVDYSVGIKLQSVSSLDLTLKYGQEHTLTVTSCEETFTIIVQPDSGDRELYLSSIFSLPVPNSIQWGPNKSPLSPKALRRSSKGKVEATGDIVDNGEGFSLENDVTSALEDSPKVNVEAIISAVEPDYRSEGILLENKMASVSLESYV